MAPIESYIIRLSAFCGHWVRRTGFFRWLFGSFLSSSLSLSLLEWNGTLFTQGDHLFRLICIINLGAKKAVIHNEVVAGVGRLGYTEAEKGGYRVSDAEVQDILLNSHTVAVVGLSPKPDRASHQVAQYLQEHGYRIIPVHPGAETILGERVYQRLEDIPEPVDIVDVFRKADDTPPVAESAVRIGAKCLWLQLGIVNEVAEAIARAAGLAFVQNRCIKIEHGKGIGGRDHGQR